MRALCTAGLLHFNQLSICRSEYPSFCKITICTLLTSDRDAFLPIVIVTPESKKHTIKSCHNLWSTVKRLQQSSGWLMQADAIIIIADAIIVFSDANMVARWKKQ